MTLFSGCSSCAFDSFSLIAGSATFRAAFYNKLDRPVRRIFKGLQDKVRTRFADQFHFVRVENSYRHFTSNPSTSKAFSIVSLGS